MCKCKTELEATLLERFKTHYPDASAHGVELTGYGFVSVANTLQIRGFMPVEAAADFKLKKGGVKSKTIKQNMFFSFCPFCGVKV